MDGLRWLLLFFGLLVVVGVYLYSRKDRGREQESSAEKPTGERVEPSLSDEPEGLDSTDDQDGELPQISVDPDAEPEPAAQEQKIITLRIVAGEHSSFAGDELALSLRGIGMRHGKFGIFHRYEGVDQNKIIFSVASLVEPGSFDLSNLKEQEIPGISLFMVLPGPVDGAEAFELMMVAARALSQSMKAELLDESGSTLSVQRERYMREEIIQYQTANLVS
jgi:cell division protein ZipA